MTAQNSVALANAVLTAWYSNIGASPVLRIYTGSNPANCAAAATGTKISEMTLPEVWMAAAASGVDGSGADLTLEEAAWLADDRVEVLAFSRSIPV